MATTQVSKTLFDIHAAQRAFTQKTPALRHYLLRDISHTAQGVKTDWLKLYRS